MLTELCYIYTELKLHLKYLFFFLIFKTVPHTNLLPISRGNLCTLDRSQSYMDDSKEALTGAGDGFEGRQQGQ